MPYILRNKRPGVLVLALTGIVLNPGGECPVKELTDPIRHAARQGYIEIVGDEKPVPPAPKTPPPVEIPPPPQEPEPKPQGKTLAQYNVTEAVQYIAMIADPAILEGLLAGESRKTVISALNRRLAEVGKVAP